MVVNLSKGVTVGYIVYPYGGGTVDSMFVGALPAYSGYESAPDDGAPVLLAFPAVRMLIRGKTHRSVLYGQDVQEAVRRIREHMCSPWGYCPAPGRVVAVRIPV